MHRDDFGGRSNEMHPTQIPGDVTGQTVILVDDVIFTGRSIRAALNAIMDFGRPRAIRLVVLVDRGGRELPIQPDVIGIRTERPQEEIRVLLSETDGVDRVEVGS